MRVPKLLRTGIRSHDRGAALRSREPKGQVAASESEPPVAANATPRRPSSAGVRTSAARLAELGAQARFARERYDLYKARTYGPRLTSPSRLEELERESERAQTSLAFAKAEAAREAGAETARR